MRRERARAARVGAAIRRRAVAWRHAGARHAGAATRAPARGPGARPRLAALGERDLDRVEVARHDDVGEHRARLVADLAREVARGDVGEREQPHAGVARQLGGLAGGRVAVWRRGRARPRGTSPRGRAGRRRRRRRAASAGRVSPDSTIRRAGARPITCSGRTPPTVSPRCRRPKSGPSATPSARAAPASKRPGRSGSASA